ncbi:hypothetical protein SAMN05444141_109256 [Pseudovibrio denitrificans]|uniref:Uncharacterized protein n=1 Tax=Pseudovibrio denitrificans TaxID=258256 RepID=A0A1I7DP36_9HYPH|nr:hypothetical protein [Pseudovibrio denitrificans]SFU13442.1 hypothetical protein SAMN05444141_109256 [Pseudovibrio denitrificans]
MTQQRNKGGRPTKFTEELGEAIALKVAAGLSISAAAAECCVLRKSVYDWKKKHAFFAEAIGLAEGLRQAMYERELLEADDSATVRRVMCALKNFAPEDWREKREISANVEANRYIGKSWRELAKTNPRTESA